MFILSKIFDAGSWLGVVYAQRRSSFLTQIRVYLVNDAWHMIFNKTLKQTYIRLKPTRIVNIKSFGHFYSLQTGFPHGGTYFKYQY